MTGLSEWRKDCRFFTPDKGTQIKGHMAVFTLLRTSGVSLNPSLSSLIAMLGWYTLCVLPVGATFAESTYPSAAIYIDGVTYPGV
jgi:hypothetical protein